MTILQQKTRPMIIPGPRGLPLIGRSQALIRLLNDPITLLRQHYQRYGVLSGLTTFQSDKDGIVLAFGEQFNQEVLNNTARFHTITTESLGDSAFKRLNSGLVNMNGERHRQQRRLMMPAFHRQAVTNSYNEMVTHTNAMLNRWKTGQRINLSAELRQLTMQIVSTALFGLEPNYDPAQFGSLLMTWAKKAISPAATIIPPLKHQLMQLSEQLEAEILGLIAQKRNAATPKHDVLSMLVHAHDENNTRLSDAELIGHAMVLFLAGHETTLNALIWTLMLLSQHPLIYSEVRDELRGLLAGSPPVPERMGDLKRLDQVIKESMRLLPPAIYSLRFATEAFAIGDYQLAQNSGVLISQFISHRLPEVFTQPDRFIPSRWNTIDPSPYEYFPFSAGPRMCIGATFASLEIRIVLSMLLQRFQLSFAPNRKIDYKAVGNVLTSKNDLLIDLFAADAKSGSTRLNGRITDLISL